ncbi:DUF2185 domain-containing protein [Flavobacterium sp. YO64]|uniref:immunity protein Imm33 domain-containing protein n=1 Tax=Flavobacterium sp. YO64 TaxID=394559 RepID=UPI00100A9DE3|nr:DUF2185 domain-containing protein [Flavobacterium sp. YO64]
MKKRLNLVILISFFGFGNATGQVKKHFKDAPNTTVFTTTFVLKEKKTITYVTHDAEDGAWQFFSNDKFESFEKVAQIVSLEQIIKIDKTLLELADLPLGYIATRKSLKDKWKIEKAE